MKKLLIPLIILGLMIGIIIFSETFKEDDEYYLNYANQVVELYKDEKLNTKGIKKKDIKAMESFQDSLDISSGQIDITHLFEKKSIYATEEANSEGITYQDGKCYIRASALKLDSKYFSDHDEVKQRVICNKYYTYIYENSLVDYEDILEDPKYDYIIDDYEKNLKGYEFTYKSVYDNSKIKLVLIVEDKTVSKIEVEY